MKTALLLFRDPLGVATGKVPTDRRQLHFFAGIFLLLGAFAFQYIYPRLLDKMPMLGSMRRLAFWKEKTVFSAQLFGYGLLICAAVLVVFLIVHAVLSTISRHKLDFAQTYRSALVACLPFLLGLLLGMVLLVPVHHYLGLMPFFGLLVACCIQGSLLREALSLPFAFTCYLTPLIMGLQFYVINLLRP